MFRQLWSEVLISAPKVCRLMLTCRIVVLVTMCMYLCSCNTVPPRTTSLALPLEVRIAALDASKSAKYAGVSWYKWKNPQLIISTKGIEVLVAGAAHGPVVKPESVRNVLEGTKLSDWPYGLIVMVVTAGLDSGNPDQAERNRVALFNSLGASGIQLVWGPPSA